MAGEPLNQSLGFDASEAIKALENLDKAMVTFGMSAATTRRFASQLTAMNAGMQPSFHSQGGAATRVGDVTINGGINVQGGSTGEKTARAIATELRRELRRGTSVL